MQSRNRTLPVIITAKPYVQKRECTVCLEMAAYDEK